MEAISLWYCYCWFDGVWLLSADGSIECSKISWLMAALTLDLIKRNGPTSADVTVPEIITDFGNFTLDFKQLRFCASPLFLQTPDLLKGLTSIVVLKVERALDIHSPHLQFMPDQRLEPTTFGIQVRLSILGYDFRFTALYELCTYTPDNQCTHLPHNLTHLMKSLKFTINHSW